MHTLKVLLLGIVLLALCLTAGRLTGSSKGLIDAAIIFIPLWALGAGINMYLGVVRAHYTVADELPVLFLVFAGPALLAFGVWYRFH